VRHNEIVFVVIVVVVIRRREWEQRPISLGETSSMKDHREGWLRAVLLITFLSHQTGECNSIFVIIASAFFDENQEWLSYARFFYVTCRLIASLNRKSIFMKHKSFYDQLGNPSWKEHNNGEVLTVLYFLKVDLKY